MVLELRQRVVQHRFLNLVVTPDRRMIARKEAAGQGYETLPAQHEARPHINIAGGGILGLRRFADPANVLHAALASPGTATALRILGRIKDEEHMTAIAHQILGVEGRDNRIEQAGTQRGNDTLALGQQGGQAHREAFDCLGLAQVEQDLGEVQ